MRHDRPLQPWQGERLESRTIAIDLIERSNQHSTNDVSTAIEVASLNGMRRSVAADQLTAFLDLHGEITLVSYDFAGLLWNLTEHRGSLISDNSLRCFWEAAEKCRVIDVMLLDQQLRYLKGVDCTKPNSLDGLAARHDADDPNSTLQSCPTPPERILAKPAYKPRGTVSRVQKTVQVYRELRARAEKCLPGMAFRMH